MLSHIWLLLSDLRTNNDISETGTVCLPRRRFQFHIHTKGLTLYPDCGVQTRQQEKIGISHISSGSGEVKGVMAPPPPCKNKS